MKERDRKYLRNKEKVFEREIGRKRKYLREKERDGKYLRNKEKVFKRERK